VRIFWATALLFLSVPINAQPVNVAGEQRPAVNQYRVGGATALRPSKIWDDGYYTYVAWPKEAELPAVFSRGSDGQEVLAEGRMMGDEYVLDRVHSYLIFRIDRSVATARRQAAKR